MQRYMERRQWERNNMLLCVHMMNAQRKGAVAAMDLNQLHSRHRGVENDTLGRKNQGQNNYRQMKSNLVKDYRGIADASTTYPSEVF